MVHIENIKQILSRLSIITRDEYHENINYDNIPIFSDRIQDEVNLLLPCLKSIDKKFIYESLNHMKNDKILSGKKKYRTRLPLNRNYKRLRDVQLYPGAN